METPEKKQPKPRFGWAAAYIEGEASTELTPLRAARRSMATAVRRVIDASVSRLAPVEQVLAVTAQLEEIAGGLEAFENQGFTGYAEAANSPEPNDGFMDKSPVLGQANPLAPPLIMDFSKDHIEASATFGVAYEGPPGCVHGGWIAASFDEVLGAAQSLNGSGGMTAYLNVSYRSPTPLHTKVHFVGELERTEGRKIFTKGTLWHGETLCAEAEGLFIAVDFQRFAEMRSKRDA